MVVEATMVVLRHSVAKTHSHTKSLYSVHLSALDWNSLVKNILPLSVVSCWPLTKMTLYPVIAIITIIL